METREEQLEGCIRRLLQTTELNLDELEEDTCDAIREALILLVSREPPKLGAEA